MGEPAAAACGQGQILFNGHTGGAPAHGVLKQPPDGPGTLELRLERNIFLVQCDAPLVAEKASGDGVEQCGLARSVGADNGDEIAGVQVEGQVFDRRFFVDSAGVEGFGNMGDGQHITRLLSWR